MPVSIKEHNLLQILRYSDNRGWNEKQHMFVRDFSPRMIILF
jgi:hypothetical protein